MTEPKHEPYVSESLLITYDHPGGLAIEVHDGAALCTKYNFAVPFPDCLIVLCARHQQMVPVSDTPNSLHEEAAKNPAAWCTGCKGNAPAVVLAPQTQAVQPEPAPVVEPPTEPQVQDASCSIGSGQYVDTGVYNVPETMDAALEEAAASLPEPSAAAPSVPFEEPAPAPPPAPKAAPKPPKPTAAPPKPVIESVMGHYRQAKATVAALEAQLDAAKDMASEALAPLTAYSPSWEYNGEWYIVAAVKGGRLHMRGPLDKKPGKQPKEEG